MNPRLGCLTVGALVIVPVQFVVVRLDKPLASAEALSLHPHTSDRHWCTLQLPCTLGCSTSIDSNVPEPCDTQQFSGSVRSAASSVVTSCDVVLVDDSSLLPAHVLSDPRSLAANCQHIIIIICCCCCCCCCFLSSFALNRDLHHQLSASIVTFLVSMRSSSLL